MRVPLLIGAGIISFAVVASAYEGPTDSEAVAILIDLLAVHEVSEERRGDSHRPHNIPMPARMAFTQNRRNGPRFLPSALMIGRVIESRTSAKHREQHRNGN